MDRVDNIKEILDKDCLKRKHNKCSFVDSRQIHNGLCKSLACWTCKENKELAEEINQIQPA